MRGNWKCLRAGLLVAAALALGIAPEAAGDEPAPTIRQQMAQFHRDWVAAGKPRERSGSLVPKWGTGTWEIVSLHAYAFQPHTSSDVTKDDGNGYRYFAAPTGVPYLGASVSLPAGAQIQSIGISGCFNDPTGTAVLGLWDNAVGGVGGGGGTQIAGPMIVPGGCQFTEYPIAPVPYAVAAGHPLYVVLFIAGTAFDASSRFNNVTISFLREVSPPPAEARFNDVPTTDPAFQFIEALAASGITGGCGDDNYCPDNPVTRRQMAVFLAKALGLHWPSYGP